MRFTATTVLAMLIPQENKMAIRSRCAATRAARTRCRVRRLLLASLVALTTNSQASTTEFEPIESIARAAERYVVEQLGDPGKDAVVIADSIDKRVRLRACEAPLEAYSAPGSLLTLERAVVGVRCHSPVQWKLYVPVRVEREDTVVVARHQLNRGDVVNAADVQTVTMRTSQFRNGYSRTIDAVVGKRLKQGITGGAAIAPSMLVRQALVKRGQRITLTTQSDGLAIRMAGIAESDGALGERVSAKNLSSGRKLEGVVRSQQLIEILAN